MMLVISWWYCLCLVATFNVLAWLWSARTLQRRRSALSAGGFRTRRALLTLSALYVAGCAYRSVFLVYDVPRICLVDTWMSSVVVGRTVATVAELAFVAQWALLLRENSRATGSLVGRVVSAALVPLIAIAETCSWYSVLTTSNVGHVAEETLWGVAAALLVASVAVLLPRANPARRPRLLGWCALGLAYVAFMFTVDVPLYWSRWLADEAAGRHYLTLAQGLLDTAQRRVVSHRWQDWKNEVAWMSLYFSVAVWISLSLVHAPEAKAALPRRRLGSRITAGPRRMGAGPAMCTPCATPARPEPRA